MQTWYVGRMDRKLCEQLVLSGMPGDFLVRRSASNPSEILCVNDYGQAANPLLPVLVMPTAYAGTLAPVARARRRRVSTRLT